MKSINFKITLLTIITIIPILKCTNEAGTKIGLKDELISNLIKWATPKALSYINNLTIPDVSTNVKIGGFLTLTINVKNIKKTIENFTPETLKINFEEPDVIGLRANDIKGKGNFNVEIKGGVIYDSETVDLDINSISTEIEIEFFKREIEGKIYPYFRFITFEINLDFDFELHGSSISQFINYIKPAIKGLLKNTLIEQIKTNVVKAVKEKIENLPLYIKINENGLALNYALLSIPKITNSSIEINSYGGLVNLNIKETLNPPFILPTNLPNFNETGKQLQIYISDYTINTALFTLLKSDLLKIHINPEIIPESSPIKLTTTNLKYIIVGIDEVYGDDKLCEVDFKVYNTSTVNFEKEVVKIILPTEIILNVRIDNKNNLSQAIKINTDFVFDINFQVNENANISANIHTMKLSNTKIVESNVPKASAILIEGEFNLLSFALKPILNNFIIKNLSFELPSFEGISFGNSTIFHNEHYVEIQISLIFKFESWKTTKVFNKKMNNLIKPFCEYGKNVKDIKLVKYSHGYYYKYKCVYNSLFNEF